MIEQPITPMMKLKITKGSGKLEGIDSLNVDTVSSSFCQRLAATVPVCQKCYSMKSLKSYRMNSRKAYQRNSAVLSLPYPMPGYLIAPVYTDVFRLFSHGDVEDANMARNVMLIVRTFPNTRFVAWSKNTAAWHEAMELDGKPDNLRLISSNGSLINVRSTPPRSFDMTFNVTPKGSDKPINCHSKCRACMRCYAAVIDDPVIIEELK